MIVLKGICSMTAIIDYDAGNLKSVEKALAAIGEPGVITREAGEILGADRVILPGVGAFGDAMKQLKKYGLDAVIRELTQKKTPLLGICLGLQLLFEGSEESEGVEGLGILKGSVVRFSDSYGLKIPHIGWNSLSLQNEGRLFRGIADGAYVYFVHSYYLKADDEQIVKATTTYGDLVHASVEQDNIFACQFHPEKSSAVGLAILKNFSQIGREEN
jgi:glutamine amidotransferase